jgi:hypothetical protein
MAISQMHGSIIHVSITFKDLFDFSITTKTKTMLVDTFNKIKTKDIGRKIRHFDKVQQIAHTYEITKIEQAK